MNLLCLIGRHDVDTSVAGTYRRYHKKRAKCRHYVEVVGECKRCHKVLGGVWKEPITPPRDEGVTA